MTNYQLVTENGYDLMECASAMQKCIRRGLEVDALFWAAEIETKFHDYLWVRLTAIVNEDIGGASPETIILVEALRHQYAFLRTKSRGPSERMALANAILAMCRARKTRTGDDLQTVVYRRRMFENWRLEVPDFALDKHTGRGRRMGRTWGHWAQHGLKLSGEAGKNPYAQDAMRLRKAYGNLPKKKGRK